MTSSRPYLIRAIYQWIVDNGMTPHLLVSTDSDRVRVPRQSIEEGRIVLNIGPDAVRSLELGDDEVSFDARFGGASMRVRAPVEHVLAIYARENGQGMAFAEQDQPEAESLPEAEDLPKPKRPHLRVIK